jgi:hypothetical protein
MQLKKKIQLVKWLKNKKNEDQVWYNNQIKKKIMRGGNEEEKSIKIK